MLSPTRFPGPTRNCLPGPRGAPFTNSSRRVIGSHWIGSAREAAPWSRRIGWERRCVRKRRLACSEATAFLPRLGSKRSGAFASVAIWRGSTLESVHFSMRLPSLCRSRGDAFNIASPTRRHGISSQRAPLATSTRRLLAVPGPCAAICSNSPESDPRRQPGSFAIGSALARLRTSTFTSFVRGCSGASTRLAIEWIQCHSPASRPDRATEDWRKPRTCPIMPKTVSTVDVRWHGLGGTGIGRRCRVIGNTWAERRDGASTTFRVDRHETGSSTPPNVGTALAAACNSALNEMIRVSQRLPITGMTSFSDSQILRAYPPDSHHNGEAIRTIGEPVLPAGYATLA